MRSPPRPHDPAGLRSPRGPSRARPRPRTAGLLAAVLLLALPLAALAAGGPGDEFERALDAPWEVVRERRTGWSLGVCVEGDPAGCYLTITPAEGDLVGDANDAENVFLQPVPDGDFRVTTSLAFFATDRGQHAGLLLYAGDDDYFFLGVGRTSERVVEAIVETDGAADVNSVPTEWTPVFLRYERRGGDVSAFASPDGILWTAVGTRPVPTGADLKMGLFAAMGKDVSPEHASDVLEANFGYFRVESPPEGETRTDPPKFTLEASPPGGVMPFTTNLTAEASWDYPGLVWTLTFGDGSTPATGEGFPVAVEHTYTTAATFHPRLTVRNALTAIGTAELSVRVEAEAPVDEVVPEEEEAGARPDRDRDPSGTGDEPTPTDAASVPAAVTTPAPEGEILVLDAEGEPLDQAQGIVRLRAAGVTGSDGAAFVVVDQDGGRRALDGRGEASWDTTGSDNGRYTVEARDGDVVLASREVVVENPRATITETAGAVVAGAATLGVMSASASAFGGRFDLLSYVGDAAQNLGEDVARRKTAEVAALDRKRKYRSLLLAGVALVLNGLMFAYAEIRPWDLALFVAALPFFGGAAFLYATTRYVSEAEAARATGATVHFRIWVPGAISMLVSTLLFRAPFGYPGFLRKNEPIAADETTRKRAAGLRATASLGIYLAVTVPFALMGLWWRYDFAEIGITMALAAFGSAVLPFQPLPGGNVWRWNKLFSVGIIVSGLALYFLYQLALLPLMGVLAVGLAGVCAAIASAVTVRGAVKDAAEIEVNEDG